MGVWNVSQFSFHLKFGLVLIYKLVRMLQNVRFAFAINGWMEGTIWFGIN